MKFHRKRRFTKEGSQGSISGGELPELTPAEQEILTLLSKDYLTPLKIALRRGTSVSAVHRHIRNLRKKGYLGEGVHKVQNFDPTIEPFLKGSPKKGTPVSTGTIRLHGQHFSIRLLHKGQQYRNARKRGNTQYVDGNTVRLHRDSVEVYGGHSFFGSSASKATARSFQYWNRFFTRLESHLGVVLIKHRSQNVRQVSAHYAEIKNGLARECGDRGDHIQVFAREDGKLWFTIDNSFRLHEAETLHPETGEADMEEVVAPFFNDLRENRPPTLSDVMRLLKEVVKVNKETAAGLNAVAQLLRPPEPPREESNGWRPDYVG